MKISNASKKVLASALSAAMVVAFAPTVAFGATPGQLVTVKYDVNGLKAADGTSAPADETVQLAGAGNLVATLANVPGSGAYTFSDGSAIAGWYFDANGNGAKDSEDIAVSGTSLTLTADTDLADGSVVTLKPYKAAWSDATATVATDPVQPGVKTGDIAALAATGDSVYKATLKKGDAVLATVNFNKSTDGAKFQLVEAYDAAHAKDAGYVLASEWGTGSYTVTVEDLADAKKSSIEAFDVIGVTFQGIFSSTGNYTVNKSAYLYKGKKVSETTAVKAEINTPTGKSATDSTAKSTAGYTVNGQAITGDTKLVDGDVLAPYYADTVIATASFKNGSIVLNGTNLNGKRAVVNGKEVALTGTTDQVVYNFGSAGAASGKYTVEVFEDTTAGTGTITKKVATAEIELASITVDANGGKFLSKQDAKTAVVGDKVSEYTFVAPTRDGFTFAGWSLDGTTVLKSSAKVAGDTVLKAVWTAATSEKPAYTWANGTLTVTAPAGYDAYVQIGSGSNNKYTGPIALAASPSAVKTVVISLQKTTGTLAPASVTIFSSNGKAVDSNLTDSLVAETSVSAKTSPKYYSKEVKATVDAAAAAIKAQGYATADEWSALVLKQETAILKAVADYETANLDAAVAGIAAADGSVSKVSETAAAKAKTAIATVVSDFDAVYDEDTKTVASTSYANKGAFVPAIAKAAKEAMATATKYAKADVDAAAAVTAQLKAAKTADEANAALEAYNKLTQAQKDLVAAADIAAAQKTATDQALIEAQDEAAIAAVKGKTVKAKAAKKTTAKLKVVTSKSGAKSTFKKTSGNKRVTVSKSGKIVVKKGLKAGKKYTVKVKATVGTQTKTVKVVVKVAK